MNGEGENEEVSDGYSYNCGDIRQWTLTDKMNLAHFSIFLFIIGFLFIYWH